MQSSVEQRCSEAFAAVRHFEKTHCLALQHMGFSYLQRRGELVGRALALGEALGVRQEVGHDGVLLMDRVMSTSKLQLAPDLLDLLAVSQRQRGGDGGGKGTSDGAAIYSYLQTLRAAPFPLSTLLFPAPLSSALPTGWLRGSGREASRRPRRRRRPRPPRRRRPDPPAPPAAAAA